MVTFEEWTIAKSAQPSVKDTTLAPAKAAVSPSGMSFTEFSYKRSGLEWNPEEHKGVLSSNIKVKGAPQKTNLDLGLGLSKAGTELSLSGRGDLAPKAVPMVRPSAEMVRQEVNDGWDRWVELATTQRALTKEEKAEARAAVKSLERAKQNIRTWTGFGGTDEEKKQAYSYGTLSAILQQKSSAGGAFVVGAISAIPFVQRAIERGDKFGKQDEIVDALYDDESLKAAVKASNIIKDTHSASPVAYSAGTIASNVAQYLSASGLIKGASSLKYMAPWVKRMLVSAGSLGSVTLLQGLGLMKNKEEWEEQESQKAAIATADGKKYSALPYSLADQVAGAFEQAIASGTGAALGTLTSLGVGKLGRAFLKGASLQTPFANALVKIAGNFSFAATETAATYFLSEEDKRLSSEQITQKLIAAFAFSVISSSIESIVEVKAAKQNFGAGIEKMQENYNKIFSNAISDSEKLAALDDAAAYNAHLREELSTKYYPGQQELVNKTTQALDALDEQISFARDKIGAVDISGATAHPPASAGAQLPMATAPQEAASAYANGAGEIDLVERARTNIKEGAGGANAFKSPEAQDKAGVKISLRENGVFSVEADGLDVGAGNLMMAESDEDFVYLERLDIKEAYRNRGYGTQALLALKDLVGPYYLAPDNSDAQRLYSRVGSEINPADYSRFGFAVDNGFGVYEINEISSKRERGILRDGDKAGIKNSIFNEDKEDIYGEEEAQAAAKREESVARLSKLVDDIGEREGAAVPKQEEGQVMQSRADSVLESTIRTPEKDWIATRTGEAKEKPMSLLELNQFIKDKFGVSINKGIRKKGVLGTYRHPIYSIRLKSSLDLPTTIHELGHKLDLVYKVVRQAPREVVAELVTNFDPARKAVYDVALWPSESYAEYMRMLILDKPKVEGDYPKTTEYMKTALPEEYYNLFMQLVDEANATLVSAEDTAQSSIALGGKYPDYRTGGEVISDKIEKTYQDFVSSMYGIKRFADAAGNMTPYHKARNAAYIDARVKYAIEGDLHDLNGRYLYPGLKKIMSAIDLKNKQVAADFAEFLICMHLPERKRDIDGAIFANPRQDNAEFANKRVAELSKQYPEFWPTALKLYQFQRLAQVHYGVASGLINPNLAEMELNRWQRYVPLNRVMDAPDRYAGGKKRYSNEGRRIMYKARGSTRTIKDPVGNIVHNTMVLMREAIENQVKISVVEASKNLEGSALFIEPELSPLRVEKFDTDPLVKKLLAVAEDYAERNQSDIDAIEMAANIIGAIDEVLLNYKVGKASGRIIRIMRNGKPTFWRVNDDLLLESLTNMTPARMSTILEVYGETTKFLVRNLTGENILWSLFRNSIGDLMTYFVYSENRSIKDFVVGAASSYVNKFKEVGGASSLEQNQVYKMFRAMGGGATSRQTFHKDLARNLEKRFGKSSAAQWLNPLEVVGFISDAIEAGPRFAAFRWAIERGYSPDEAMYLSSDTTGDFRNTGRISREINKAFPFFSSNIVGIDKLARFLSCSEKSKSERKSAIPRRVGAFLAASAAIAAMMYAVNSKDEESKKDYEALSNYTKNSYWCFPKGNGEFITVKKPREIAIASSFMEAMLWKEAENDIFAMEKFYEYAIDTALPSPLSDVAKVPFDAAAEGLAPALEKFGAGFIGSMGLLGVVAQIGMNKDFLGKPIVSPSLERLMPKDQYNDMTSQAAKTMGQALNISPMKIDHFMQSTLSGNWKAQRSLFPVGEDVRDWTLGVRGMYVRDNLYSTDAINRLYDAKDQFEREKNSNPDDMAAALDYRSANSLTSFYSRFNSLSKSAHNSEEARAARSMVFDIIWEYNKYVKTGEQSAQRELLYKICTELKDPSLLQKAMQTSIKDDDGQQHDLDYKQYLEYQVTYLTEYWNNTAEVMTNQSIKTMVGMQNGLAAAGRKAEKDAAAYMLRKMGIETKQASKNKEMASIGLDPIDYMLYETAMKSTGASTIKETMEVLDDLMTRTGITEDEWTWLLQQKFPTTKRTYSNR